MGFASSKLESSLFVRPSHNTPISILLYVDDLVIAGGDLGEIDRVKSQLAASFDMKDLGDIHYFLGIKVNVITHGVCSSSSGWQTVSPSQLIWTKT